MMENVFGVDVAKRWIDVVGPDGHERIGNDGLTAFALRVCKQGGRVAFEASGGYETPLRTALAEARLLGQIWALQGCEGKVEEAAAAEADW